MAAFTRLAHPPGMNPTLKCIIVDDDPEWLALVERTLRGSNISWETVVFSRGLDALEYINRNRADAIVTDLIMPELHGLLLIEAIRQIDAEIPIVMISVDESVEAESLASGANAFVAKSRLKANLARIVEDLWGVRNAGDSCPKWPTQSPGMPAVASSRSTAS